MLLLTACAGTSDPASGDPAQDLRHRDPRIRMEAAYQAAQSSRQDLIGTLIGNLRDRDDSVRFVSNIALKRMTGQDFDFRSYAGFHDREAAIDRWTRWHAGVPDARAVTAGTAAGSR